MWNGRPRNVCGVDFVGVNQVRLYDNAPLCAACYKAYGDNWRWWLSRGVEVRCCVRQYDCVQIDVCCFFNMSFTGWIDILSVSYKRRVSIVTVHSGI